MTHMGWEPVICSIVNIGLALLSAEWNSGFWISKGFEKGSKGNNRNYLKDEGEDLRGKVKDIELALPWKSQAKD